MFSDLAQTGHIHELKYYQLFLILKFEFVYARKLPVVCRNLIIT